jgi:hypothetical protein
MFRGRFGLMIALAVTAMLSVAAGAGLIIVYAPLPDPATATPEQLFRWLVTRDLANEPLEVQQAIIHRIDADLGPTGELTQGVSQLKASYRTMLWTNIGTLLQPWLATKADEYAQLPVRERQAYLDRFLDRVDQWNKIGTACLHDETAGAKSDNSLTKLIAEKVADCSRHAEPAQRKRIADFMSAVQMRWIARQFGGFSMFGKR